MELLTLDTLFQPVRLIENYSSLIWTERYSTAGDFELVSNDVQNTLARLPLESFVCLRESTVPMIVEAHKIAKPKGRAAEITVTGRSFDSVLERRASVNNMPSGAGRALWTIPATKSSDAAYQVIRTVIGDPVARGSLAATTPVISPLDALIRANGTQLVNLPLPADFVAGTTTSYEIKAQDLYSTVLELLEQNHHGIRAVRPPATGGKTTVDLEIYNGADLRTTRVFDARYDQFDDATYLLSYQGSTNIAYIYGGGTGASGKGMSIRKNTAGSEVSGLDRRVILVDEMSDATLSTDAARTSRALVELYQHNATAIFDGELSQLIGSFFNLPVAQGGYGLGDIVQLNGEFGISRIVRVVEFIRSSDSTGTKVYPAFQVVEE